MNKKRVVITGIGLVSPVGVGFSDFSKSVLTGVSGEGLISQFDSSQVKSEICCAVDQFDPEEYIEKKSIKRTSRFIQFAIASAKMAVQDAGVDVEGSSECAVFVGTGAGGYDFLEDTYTKFFKRGAKSVGPFSITNIIPNMAASNVAIALKTHGLCTAPVAACASGLQAIEDAYYSIREGRSRAAIAGGSESTLTPLVCAGYEALGVLAKSNPDQAHLSRPFDKDRSGFVIGEGAGALFMESLEDAQAGGREIYCEVLGCGSTCDASHITSPDTSGHYIKMAMETAVRRSGVDFKDVSFINAHGTSTKVNDEVEGKSILELFGKHDCGNVPVTALKSMVGHTLGASGALGLISSIAAIKQKTVPPTINSAVIDPEIPNLNLVRNPLSVESDRMTSLVNAFGFGGHNTSILIGG